MASSCGRFPLLAFHEHLDKRTPIAPEEREAFWLQAESLRESSVHSDFIGDDDKGPQGCRCLLVDEFC